MPGNNNHLSISSFPHQYLPRVGLNRKSPFNAMRVGNAASDPPTPHARRGSSGSAEGVLQRAGSFESLDSFSGPVLMDAPGHFDASVLMDDRTGGEGVGRADFPPQIARSHPLDPSAHSPAYQLQHSDDVERTLSPLTRRWDARAAAGSAATGTPATLEARGVFCETQKDMSIMSREVCARKVLSELGLSRSRIEELLKRQAASPGGTAVIDACRLLSMPELRAELRIRSSLEKRLDAYLDAARGDYSGVYRAFKHDAFRELKALKDGIEQAVDTIGRSAVKDRLLADSAPALVHALERKNPGMSPEALRRSLPDLINAQGFSALGNRLDKADASGLLQDTAILPQLVQTADTTRRPPADSAADPVKDFVKHLLDVLGAMKAPIIENNARQIINQDGWSFQGVKDPRPAPTAEPPAVPIADTTEAGDDELHSVVDELDTMAAPVDMPEEEIETDTVPQPETHDHEPDDAVHASRATGRHGVPVHPLHSNLMKDLLAHQRFQHLAAGGVTPLPLHLQEAERHEDDDDAGGAGMQASNGVSPFGRLKSPLPLGEHAPPARNRDEHGRA